MADLSTLDETQPLGSQLLSEGDERIRETRDAVKTSFGVEHALGGVHKFLLGSAVGRPASGNIGRIYLNTEHRWIEYDTGSVFNQLSAAGVFASNDDAVRNIAVGVPLQAFPAFPVPFRSNSRVVVLGYIALGTNHTFTAFTRVSVSFGASTLVLPDILLPAGIASSAVKSYVPFLRFLVPGSNGQENVSVVLESLLNDVSVHAARAIALVL